MKNTMVEFTSPQERISGQQAETVKRLPALWTDMIAGLNQPGLEDRAWLMYSANYLFNTAGVRWAMDPIRPCHRMDGAPSIDITGDLRGLAFVVLTHRHADHLDMDLIASLKDSNIVWVVPDFLLPLLQHKTGLSRPRIIVPRILEPVEIHGIRLTAFDGLHWERISTGDLRNGGSQWRGVPSTGYLLEFSGKRWLFPGDTRTYDASQLPLFGPVDGLFAHVWLGRGAGLQPQPPLLNDFTRFCLDLQPGRVLLTHLNEFGREPEDIWDPAHADCIHERLNQMSPGLSVERLLMGDSTSL